MREAGQICLLLSFVTTGYAAVATCLGWRCEHTRVRNSGLIAGMASLATLSAAMSVLLVALLTKDFRFDYVAHYVNRTLPWHYSVSALWVGQAGSLLLWSWLAVVLSLLFRWSICRSQTGRSLADPAFAVLMAFCCFLVAIMVFAVDPLAASLVVSSDGAGLSPILQHPAMLIHPPIVFLAYAAWAIPFALAIAALLTNDLSPAWTRLARPWALFAWTVLGAGILIGANWAYRELGWGGYWAWDPVENGSFIPWLLGTSAIHTLMAWRGRGMLKKSALATTVATFAMCNFATFLTRSGIFSSLHAFSQSPIGWSFLGLMIVVAAAAGGLIAYRRRELDAERPIASLWCRESMIVLNTVVLTLLAMVVCFGTVSAAISDAIWGKKILLGMAYYNNTFIPAAFVVLLATAAAPLLRWGSAPTRAQTKRLLVAAVMATVVGAAAALSGVQHFVQIAVYGLAAFSVITCLASVLLDAAKFDSGPLTGVVRAIRAQRRQYAGFVIHLGLFCLAVGVAGSSLASQRRELVLSAGQSVQFAGRNIELLKVTQSNDAERLVVEAWLKIQHGTSSPIVLRPAQHFHHHPKEWTTETAVASSWSGDFYTILHEGDGQDGVHLTLVDKPLMRFIWSGGVIMALGSLATVWPSRRNRAVHHASAKPKPGRQQWQRAAAAAIVAIQLQAVCESDRAILTDGDRYEVTAFDLPSVNKQRNS